MRRSLAALLLAAGCAQVPSPDASLANYGEMYHRWGPVDDEKRWAPEACDAPFPDPRASVSRDESTHGRKLYYLFARDSRAYLHAREGAQPEGQVIVKESWKPAPGSTMVHPVTGERGPLFLMIKSGEVDSDEGWIYATLAPDRRTVTASGKLSSCMECHQARKDRIFGVKSCAAPE